jgi:hypothetical protein
VDADDWAKEDCECGHRRHGHQRGTGACRHTKLRRQVPDNLPAPEFATDAGPFDAPLNWPDSHTWPLVEVPCCPGFVAAGTAAAEAGP